jgi:histidinol-phosphate aminotransferase
MKLDLNYSKLMSSIVSTVPFKGPNALEREFGTRIRLRLGANESMYGISPAANESILAALCQTNWYGDPQSYDLKSKLASRFGIERENLVIGNGIDELLAFTLRVFLDPGDAIVLSDGTYPAVRYLAAGCGVVCHPVPYINFKVDVDGLIEAANQERAKLVYLGNPDNPTGSFLDSASIDRLMAGLPKYCLLLLDEAYIEFTDGTVWRDHAPLHDRVIRFRTFSKVHGLAGLRIGYAMAAAPHIVEFNKIRLQFSVNRIAQAAAIASLTDDIFINEVVSRNREGRQDYYDLGSELGLDVVTSSTNFALIIFEEASTAEEVWQRLLDVGVFTSHPSSPGLDRCLRVTVGNTQERAEFRKALIGVCNDLLLVRLDANGFTPNSGTVYEVH